MRRRPALAATAVALLVAGCTSSTTTHRTSAPASTSRTPSATTASSTAASSLPPVTSTGAAATGTSAVPSPTRTAPGVPACAPTVITVPKAPFCFTLPQGFANYSTLKNYGKGWTYRTLVSIGQHDLIEVFAAAGADTDRASEAALKAMYQKVFLLRVGALNITQADPPRRTSVDGARAYRQVARYGNGVSTDITTVYRGHTVVSIQCQSLEQKATVEAACTSVMGSLDLVRR